MGSPDYIDLALSRSEARHEAGECTAPEPPKYPWGLQLHLEQTELDKLGIRRLPSVGGEWRFSAVAEVTSVSEQQMAGGEYECCVRLQIKGLAFEPAAAVVETEAPAAEPSGMLTVMSKYRGAA